MCAGDAAGLIVGGEDAANGAGATAGAGFVAAELCDMEYWKDDTWPQGQAAVLRRQWAARFVPLPACPVKHRLPAPTEREESLSREEEEARAARLLGEGRASRALWKRESNRNGWRTSFDRLAEILSRLG